MFRVIAVACVRLSGSSGNERDLPATLDGNATSLTFDVGPDQDGDTIDCRFSFDPALVPRLRSSAAEPSAPPTDTSVPALERSQPADRRGLLAVLAVGAAVGALVMGTTRRRPSWSARAHATQGSEQGEDR